MDPSLRFRRGFSDIKRNLLSLLSLSPSQPHSEGSGSRKLGPPASLARCDKVKIIKWKFPFIFFLFMLSRELRKGHSDVEKLCSKIINSFIILNSK